MLVVEAWRGPIRDHLVMFPQGDQLEQVAATARSFELYRVRHALIETVPARAQLVGRSTTTCVNLCAPLDDIHHQMHAKSCRYEIRKAERLGTRLTFRRNGDRARDDFFRLYNEFVAWKG